MTESPNESPTLDGFGGRVAEAVRLHGDGRSGDLQRDVVRAKTRESLFGEPPRRPRLGRYVVLERIGRGGMGVVHAAYDPELDRKVAIKLVDRRGIQDDVVGRQRLLREAQALAKITHPHVVAVHDVGTVDDSTDGDSTPYFVAMEYIDGPTLSRWSGASRHHWRETLRVALETCRGLAAVHACGLVHRDLKPDNVMLGSDGRVRVMDFGLVRQLQASASDQTDLVHLREHSSPNEPLTIAGAVIGTPAYMAPEQFAGGMVDERSDQFSLCVTIWEAFYGERPFAGDSLHELASVVLAGRVRAPTHAHAVPHWVRTILERGLALHPEARWPDVNALIVALERGRARTRTRRATVAVAVLACVGLGLWGAGEMRHRNALASCEEQGEIVHDVWNDAASARLRGALQGLAPRGSETAATTTISALDEHAHAWARARTRACVATDVDREWAGATRDASLWCLELRRQELNAIVGELPNTALGGYRVVEAVSELTPIEPCVDPRMLARWPAPPAEEHAELTSLYAQLFHARVLEAFGDYTESESLARTVMAEADATSWPSIAISARHRLASVLSIGAQYADAEALFEEAWFAAAASGQWDFAADAAIRLVHVVGVRLARHSDGRRWARQAEVALTQLGTGEDTRYAALLTNIGAVQQSATELDDAEVSLRGALEIRERTLGADHPSVAGSRTLLATVYRMKGDTDAARELLLRALELRERVLGIDHLYTGETLSSLGGVEEGAGNYAVAVELHGRALAIRENALGPDHPDVAQSLTNLGSVYKHQGRFEDAQQAFTRALAIEERVRGSMHPRVGRALGNLAVVAEAVGDRKRARELYERVEAIFADALGADHADVAKVVYNVGNIDYAENDLPAAVVRYQRALAIWEAKLGAEHPVLATGLSSLANAKRQLGELDEAQRLHERALAIRERSSGKDHPEVAHSLVGLAHIALERANADGALRAAERALRVRSEGGVSDAEIAEAELLVARALWATGDDGARAEALAASAASRWAAAPQYETQLAEARRVLREHRSAPR